MFKTNTKLKRKLALKPETIRMRILTSDENERVVGGVTMQDNCNGQGQSYQTTCVKTF